MTPVPTTAILPDIGPMTICSNSTRATDETAVSIRLSAPPGQSGRLEHTVEALRFVGAQLKAFPVHLHQPYLTLSEPIREEAHRHLMRQRPLGLVDKKAT